MHDTVLNLVKKNVFTKLCTNFSSLTKEIQDTGKIFRLIQVNHNIYKKNYNKTKETKIEIIRGGMRLEDF